MGLAHVEEDDVPVGVSIVEIDSVESLRELHVAYSLPNERIHHEAHGFSERLAVVDVVVAIEVQHVRSIGQHRRHSHL